MSHYLVTGVTGGSAAGGGAPNRLEIHDFVKQEDQFSLYIQALQFIYSGKSQAEVDSFFQIGGIHGLPYVPWDGSGSKPVDSDAWEGYCTHGSVLFPTFHRPYVVLIEQAIQRAAVTIADSYTANLKAQYQNAAQMLRQPYWDWASNAVPPPEVISLDQVTIVNPTGQKVSVDNPLRRYTFHPIDPSFPEPYASWPTTLRHPPTEDADAQDNVEELTSTLESAASQLKTKTYNLLTRVHTWPAFSNHTPGDGGSASNSLEGIHDGIHVDVGGNGQMSDPSVAAFDPIFFMHHAQVDRLLSLWSALNPGVWTTNGPAGDGTWTIAPDTEVGKNTDLTPFWNTQSSYWVSTAVTDTSAMGYTYPEFNNLKMSDAAAVKTAIANKVNQLYGGHRGIFPNLAAFSNLAAIPQQSSREIPATNTVETTAVPSSGTPSSAAGTEKASGPSESGEGLQVRLDSSGGALSTHEVWDWTARVHIKKHEVGGSFKVLFFLGSVPNDPRGWHTDPSFIGAFHGFVNSSAERCTNCQRQREVVLEGFVHLNEGISRLSNLNSFDPNVVKPYLQKNLHWRVQKVSGDVVDISTIPSLEILAIATRLTLPPGAVFPVPAETNIHHDITHGRPGGSKHGVGSE